MPRLPYRLIFLGAPGVGKGTYASKLTKKWQIPHISTGDMVRAEIKTNSDLGKKFIEYSNSGSLVPDEIISQLAEKRLANNDCINGWLLDGFPRTIPQADLLSKFAAPSLCVNIYLPTELLVQKITARRVCTKCGANYNLADIRYGDYNMPPLLPKPSDCNTCNGDPPLVQRADDTEEIVQNRLEIYDNETSPLINYYEKRGILVNFHVKKGIDDMPVISQIIEDSLN